MSTPLTPLQGYAAPFFTTPVPAKKWGVPFGTSVMLGHAERRKVWLLCVKLFSKNSNLYDHDTSTSQTDRHLGLAILRHAVLRVVKTVSGQIDRRTSWLGNTAPRCASGGKNCQWTDRQMDIGTDIKTSFTKELTYHKQSNGCWCLEV